MSIAGVKPVDHAYLVANNTEYYTIEKVRDILVEFGVTYLPFIDETGVEDVVDEFMEIGEE